jgi:hypothetical protein
MQPFYASNFLAVMRGLAAMAESSADELIPEARRLQLHNAFKNYQPTLGEMGLSASKVSAGKLSEVLGRNDCKWSDLKDLCKELQGRLIDETDERVFFTLTPRESEFYEQPRKGWEPAITRFPGIVDDVEEASKSWALSRYAAAVFHSVQIVEVGLIDLGSFLKVNDPNSGWTAVALALRKVINTSHKERSQFERRNFGFLEQVQGTVEGLKNAWRNKISHAGGRLVIMSKEFSPEVAEEILYATRGFMRRLAEGLPPPKRKRGQS